VKITHYPNQEVDTIWHKVKDYFEATAEYTYGRYTANDIRTGIKSNSNQQLWIAHEEGKVFGFVVTEPLQYPQLKSLIMHFTGGEELNLWKEDMLKTIQGFAYSQGCDIIESLGRGGWGKIFKGDGFDSKFVFYELPVKEIA
jgi:hypothetical protein|tara:strand:+ start:480 stop:905 length:426 start_codon:yes stop_codon:yes gene_type:complete